MTDIGRAARWGTWVTCGVLLLVLYRDDALGGTGVRRTAYFVSLGAWAATALLLAFPRGRGRKALSVAVSVVTIGATAAVTLAVPAALQHTNANWAVGVNGWLLLTTASGGRLSVLVFWLVLPPLFALLAAVPAGPPEIVLAAARALGIVGLQMPIGLAARALDHSAAATRELHLQQEAIRTGQFVAAALHDDRLRRSRAVAAAVEPVLATLAAEDPDETLRRRSRVAATQVRRLLAEWHGDGADPLGDDLSACLDEVQSAGVPVSVTVHAAELPPPLRQAAVSIVRELSRLSLTRLRVTAVSAGSLVQFSAVARTAGSAALDVREVEVAPPVAIGATSGDDTIWVELTCPV
jgi:hypothetical protein